MREIKFRAWDKIADNFVYFYLKPGEINIQVKAPEGVMGDWEEFTGLKDSKGIEIYEGDVVVSKWLSGFACEDDYEEAHANDNKDAGEGKTFYTKPEVVDFKDGEFWPREYYNQCDDGFYSYRVFDVEIIGNVHENPSLIDRN